MDDSKIDYNALQQALDTSWGRSSTPKTASYSVKFSFMGTDHLLVTYQAIVNFGSQRQMIEMKRRYVDESKSIIDEVLKQVKSNYKALTGSALNVKETSSADSIEMTGMALNSPRRTAYFKRKTVVEVG
jgi:hypothetical protein